MLYITSHSHIGCNLLNRQQKKSKAQRIFTLTKTTYSKLFLLLSHNEKVLSKLNSRVSHRKSLF